ncbi:hypothetical protein AB0399_35655 [Streptomyces sp. NPDC088194]|uniref:hypothetical protein n=1 Tax=Streptomyces sp. NPDC088194 TaxID=3154931 RepID=UPI00344B7C04
MITEPEESWEAEEGDSAYGRPHADDARPALNGPRGGGDWGEGSGRRALLPGPRPEVMAGLPPRPSPLGKLPGWLRGALGGVLVASLAGAALAYAGVLPQRHRGPDMHGYRIGQNPCTAYAFDAFGTAVKSTDSGVWPAVFEHTARLDRAQCGFVAQGTPTQGTKTSYTVQVDVTLHRYSDPAAEFDAERSVDPSNLRVTTRTRAVPRLGDKAYLLSFDDPTRILEVLSGGAVITLRLESTTTAYGTGPDTEPPDLPDLDRLTPSLAAAARAIMTTMAS